MSLFDLAGKVAVVTGGIGLLGRQHCIALAEAGATVVCADLDGDTAIRFSSTLPSATGVALDVTRKDSLVAARDLILREHGRIDILVNNAALNDTVEGPSLAASESRFEVYPLDRWLAGLEVNVTGVFLTSQVLGSVMAERGGGSIINIASTYALVGPDQRLYRAPDGAQLLHKSPVYPTSKGAVLSFTRYLAAYWGEKGVRVNALSPGGVENGQDGWFVERYADRTPIGRMASPTDYRGALVFLASDASAYMTGSNLVVDGGWTAW